MTHDSIDEPNEGFSEREPLPFEFYGDLHCRVPFFLLGQTRPGFPSGTSSNSLRAKVHSSPQMKHYQHMQVELPDKLHLHRDENGHPVPIAKYFGGKLEPDTESILEATTITPPSNPDNYSVRRVYYATDFATDFLEFSSSLPPMITNPVLTFPGPGSETIAFNTSAEPNEILRPLDILESCSGEFPRKEFEPLKQPSWFRLYRSLALFELFFHFSSVHAVKPILQRGDLLRAWWVPVVHKEKCSPYADVVSTINRTTEGTRGIVYARNLTAQQFGDLHWRLTTLFPSYVLY